MELYKYQGAGNDFLIIDNRNGQCSLSRTDIRALCDRRYGFGSDGLMLLEQSEKHDFKMVFFNPDGSGGMMCGNGGRCIVAFASRFTEKKNFVFEAPDGLHSAEIIMNNRDSSRMTVRLKMIDVLTLKHIEEEHGYFVDTGTRHFVKLVRKGLKQMDILPEGRRIRNSGIFAPAGVNVNFVEPSGDSSIAVRTFEKGVEDETFACGTGIVASALASFYAGVTRGDMEGNVHIDVQAKRDRLSVDFKKGKDGSGIFAENVWLTGPAVMVGKIICDSIPQ